MTKAERIKVIKSTIDTLMEGLDRNNDGGTYSITEIKRWIKTQGVILISEQ